MDRTIKFRAWDKDNEKMIFNDLLLPIEGDHMVFKSWPENEHSGDFGGQYELMQYTGLKDKNGKEIYEKDIVKIKLIKGHEFVAEMVWYHLGWKARSIEGRGGQGNWNYKYFENPKDIEVIGNIYENKDLLSSNNGSRNELR